MEEYFTESEFNVPDHSYSSFKKASKATINWGMDDRVFCTNDGNLLDLYKRTFAFKKIK